MNRTLGRCPVCGRYHRNAGFTVLAWSRDEDEDAPKRYCHHCYNKLRDRLDIAWDEDFCAVGSILNVCHWCGKAAPYLDQTSDTGEWFCEDCAYDHLYHCRNCERWYENRDEVEEYEDEWVCHRCICDDYVRCEDCGDLIHVDHDDEIYVTDHGHVCSRCREDYLCCDRCGCYMHDDDVCHPDHDEDRVLCERCCDIENEERRGLMGYHSFGDYHPRVCDDERESETMLFGVELECDKGCFYPDDFVRWTEEDGNLVHFERDGSLSEDGVECITQPCSLRFHQGELGWDKLCEALRGQGFYSHDTTTCGLHVHMTRRLIPQSVIAKMCVFVNRYSEFWSAVARRSEFYSASYDKDKRPDPSDGWYRHVPDWVKDGWDFKREKYLNKSRRGHGARYTAVNLTNRDTVEIRIAKGSLNYRTVLATIELYAAMVPFLQGVAWKELMDRRVTERFVRFVYDCSGRYPNACKELPRLTRHTGLACYCENASVKEAIMKMRTNKKAENKKNKGDK